VLVELVVGVPVLRILVLMELLAQRTQVEEGAGLALP
jgi:hypothetical protein